MNFRMQRNIETSKKAPAQGLGGPCLLILICGEPEAHQKVRNLTGYNSRKVEAQVIQYPAE